MTIDLDAMTINKSKFMADGDKYFELYRKHIPGNIVGNILLLSIGNLDCISKIMSMNPNAKYLIIDRKTVIKSLTIIYKDIYDIKAIENDDVDLYNIIQELDMKFDCIVMNPPYQKNLHLKILAEAIKHLKDNNSVCVNLSPVRWLQDPLAKHKKRSDYNKFEESVSKHIEKLEIISTINSQQLFNILINTDIGIYKLTKTCLNSYAYMDEWKKTTNEKHFNKIKTYWNYPELECYSEDKNKKLWFVPIRLITNPARATFYNICSNIGPIFNKKTITNIFYKDAMYKSKTFSDDRQLHGIWFSSKEQAFNFYNSTFTICYKYFCSLVLKDVHISLVNLPWLGDVINPRTGLKGYEGEWTDEDLYKFFNITSDERKIIEETMAKYK